MTNILALNYRNAFAHIASAVHVITTNGNRGPFGITMTAVTSVSDQPPTVALCVNRQAAINKIIKENKHLCINTLAANQLEAAQDFAGITQLSQTLRFEKHAHYEHAGSRQIELKGALTHLHGRVIEQHEIGTHTVFYVQVQEVSTPGGVGALSYFKRDFHLLG